MTEVEMGRHQAESGILFRAENCPEHRMLYHFLKVTELGIAKSGIGIQICLGSRSAPLITYSAWISLQNRAMPWHSTGL